MKCETCKYGKMCFLRQRHMEMTDIVAELTNIEEPEFGRACDAVAALYDDCVNYEEKI